MTSFPNVFNVVVLIIMIALMAGEVALFAARGGSLHIARAMPCVEPTIGLEPMTC